MQTKQNTMYDDNIFAEFIGQTVKVPYKDGPQFKIARGILETATNGFVKIRGPAGVIVINENNIEKMALANHAS